ncbi:GNAT family N-acetyltransferase [Halobacteriales archaeon QH_10_67_13]|nr:MAG: GNAT family N-acetyltransferase [Halobacteriales archaeon QH_10_67_13]
MTAVELREATHDDYDAVTAFTSSTWDGDDYIPDVYHDWIEGEHRHTLVADPEGSNEELAGIAQAVMLSEREAWTQGMRVNPTYRSAGIGTTLTHALFDWARDRDAVVARNMVFSWNRAGLGLSRTAGFEPATEFRWLHVDPDPDASGGGSAGETGDLTATTDPVAAWTCWRESEAHRRLHGLALDPEETWALRELTQETLATAAEETALLTVTDDRGCQGLSYRTRTYNSEGETGAEYGVAAWEGLPAARELFGAIAADAMSIGADRTRVLVPETARHVSDGAACRIRPAENPDFVLAADLTTDYRD